jgi:hypothetical protein
MVFISHYSLVYFTFHENERDQNPVNALKLQITGDSTQNGLTLELANFSHKGETIRIIGFVGHSLLSFLLNPVL